ncbi:putative nucleotide-diphospho-sugar transferase [Helianthus anomalus]
MTMTLDFNYLRGFVAAVHSILKHTSCPENLYFHFIASGSKSLRPEDLTRIIKTIFPYLGFRVYSFDDSLVKDLISYSIRGALDM